MPSSVTDKIKTLEKKRNDILSVISKEQEKLHICDQSIRALQKKCKHKSHKLVDYERDSGRNVFECEICNYVGYYFDFLR